MGEAKSGEAELLYSDTPEIAADYVERAAPRLVKVAAVTAISFALYDGANGALLELKNADQNTREIASGYGVNAISMTAVRLTLLLDADPKVVSFQTVYRRLERPDVVDTLVRRARDKSPWAEALEDRVEEDIRASVASFLRIYRAIDWHDLHGRLQHFRNHGLAHLTPQQIQRRVTYAEITSLVRSVAALSECLTSFDPDGVPLRADEIADWSDRAKSVWKAAFGTGQVMLVRQESSPSKSGG
jgi:hypothetical protein